MFDLEKFKKGDCFVHLPTQEIYDEAMKFLEENGISWQKSKATDKQIWENYKEETAISFEDYIYYADKPFYEEGGCKELPMNIKLKDFFSDNHLDFTLKRIQAYNSEENNNEQDSKEKEMVKSPNHYIGDLGLEVEEVLRNFIPRYEDSYVAHRVASALEYLLRAPLKNGKQDLEKARYNITQALEYINSKEDSFE